MLIAYVVYSGPAFIKTRYPAIEFLSGFFLCAIAVILFVFMASCLYNAKYIRGAFFSLAFALFLYYLPDSWSSLRNILHDRLVFHYTFDPKLPDNVQCVFDAIQRDVREKLVKDYELAQMVCDMTDKQVEDFKKQVFEKYAESPKCQVVVEPAHQNKPALMRKLRPIEIERLWQRIKTNNLSRSEYSDLPLEKRKMLLELAKDEDNVKAFVEWLFKSGLL